LNLPVIIIGGPTGSGKNRAAIEIAKKYPAEIVNADSRQIYKDLILGTNQPSEDEKQLVPHHLFAFLPPQQSFTAADYERFAYPITNEIQSRGNTPIVVGGTGFYIKALLRGTWSVPEKNPELRQRLRVIEEKWGKQYLHQILARVDPESAKRILAQDSYRVSRALEIYFQTGSKVSTLTPKKQRFEATKLFLDLPVDELRERIQVRTRTLIESGWIEEVRNLLERYPDFEEMPAAASLGYREIIQYIQGNSSSKECEELIVRKTWRYARRQRTWFRNQDQFTSVRSMLELQKIVDSVLQ
jgi:tRNA dimethylallyltransferase